MDFNIVIEKGEDGYYISDVIELPGCHTQGKTIDELMERTKEAIKLYLEVKGVEERETRFIGVQKIEVKNEPVASN